MSLFAEILFQIIGEKSIWFANAEESKIRLISNLTGGVDVLVYSWLMVVLRKTELIIF